MPTNRCLARVAVGVVLLAAFDVTAKSPSTTEAERFQRAVDWLADDARLGRGLGTAGLEQAGHWLAERMVEIGLEPGHGESYLQPFETGSSRAFNVVGRLAAGAEDQLSGDVVIGAHYDHLGHGGPNSLDDASHVIHNGADDNASGTAALLLVAQDLEARRRDLRRDIYFVAFTGEETGNLGSNHFTGSPPPGLAIEKVVAVLNMDMVGRLRGDTLEILGAGSAAEWSAILLPLCEQAALSCSLDSAGYGPSDHTPFHSTGAPVLHFFTGPHDDFHTSRDDSDKINAEGGVQVARLVANVAAVISGRVEGLTYQKVADQGGEQEP